MPTYQYVAISEEGIKRKGKEDGANRKEVCCQLKRNSLYPIYITKESILNRQVEFSFINCVKKKDLQLFCQHISCFLKSGVPILRALQVEQNQTQNPVLKKGIKGSADGVQKGESLSFSMRQHKVFPKILVNMVIAGEQSGKLEFIFNEMAKHYHKEVRLHQTIKKAITYPSIVSIISFILVIFMMIFVVPTYVHIYEGIQMELPISTKILIGFSEHIHKKWYLLGILFIIVGIGMLQFSKTDRGKTQIGWFILNIPIIGNMQSKIVAARFARILGILLKSGLSIVKSLELTINVIDNAYISKKLLKVKNMVSEGSLLSYQILKMKIFPHMVVHMIQVGEETGELEENLQIVASFYDEEIETKMAQLTEIIEPIIIGILAIIVGFIVISLIQPVFHMYDGLYNI